EPLDPYTGSNIEAGLKWAPRNGHLNLAFSAYHIEQKGFAQQDNSVPFTVGPNNITCCYLTESSNGANLSEGADLELTGELARGWQISSGYTYNHNEYKGSD